MGSSFIYLFIYFFQATVLYRFSLCPKKRFKSTCAQYGCYSIYLCDYFGCMLVSSWPFIPTQSELPMSSQQGAMSAKSQIDRRDWILLPPPCKEVHPSLSTGKSSGWSWASTPTRLSFNPALGIASFDTNSVSFRHCILRRCGDDAEVPEVILTFSIENCKPTCEYCVRTSGTLEELPHFFAFGMASGGAHGEQAEGSYEFKELIRSCSQRCRSSYFKSYGSSSLCISLVLLGHRKAHLIVRSVWCFQWLQYCS